MKAMVLHAMGEAMKYRDMPVPKVGPNDVLVRVRACGVGLTVVKLIQTPGRVTSYPRIPGHELAGDVVEVGAEVRTVKAGDRVTSHYYLTCGQCGQCRSGRETLCERPRGNVGAAIDGGYAEYIVLPERNIVPIPDGVSYVDAGVASDAIATPYHACHKEARIGPGDTLLVIGAGGGVGVHMVQMGRVCGARVIAADIGEDKLNLAAENGADELIDARKGNIAEQVKAITGGRGADAAIDMVGARETLEAALASLGMTGRLVMIGSRPKNIYGEDPTFSINPEAFSKRALEIHSSRYVTAAEIGKTLELVRLGRIKPVVSRTFALKDAETAHELIRKNATTGRIALVLD